jgi:hypothetical protein
VADSWFTGFADELARCLLDAERCAEACERLLEKVESSDDAAMRKRVLDAVVGPTAVARVLTDLIDFPAPLVLAAARLCRDTSRGAVEALRGLDAQEAIRELAACAESCDRFLDVAS